MHAHFVKETLRQAIGRGRAVSDKSVQVVVVSNESIGMPLASQPLPLVDDAEDDTLHHALKLTDTVPINNTIAFVSDAPVNTSAISLNSGVTDRTVRRHFSTLISTGLLRKKGERGGVTVPAWVMGYYRDVWKESSDKGGTCRANSCNR
jgi:hypothetical protein